MTGSSYHTCYFGSHDNSRRLFRGQAMVEFLVILPVLLLIVLGTLQFALIYHAKITLNYATFEAVRAGSLNRTHLYAMEHALARGLAPLYTHSDDIAAYKTGRDRVNQQIRDGYLKIDVINPSPAMFANTSIAINGSIIPNDNLIYRGYNGNTSAPTIQDANLLKIQVYYCYELIVPFANRILWTMMRYAPKDVLPDDVPDIKPEFRVGRPETGTFAQECIVNKRDNDQYYGIPINAQGIMRMQSPPELLSGP